MEIRSIPWVKGVVRHRIQDVSKEPDFSARWGYLVDALFSAP